MNRTRRARGAFTLLEILIAIGILAIGLVTVFSLFPIAIYAVKDTVEGSRGASLSETARADLYATRADMRVMDAGSQPYGGGFVPFGPWEKPAHLLVFRSPLYQFIDSASTGVLHNRVVFDDRTMVPISLVGLFDGSDTVAVQRGSLTRDADLPEHYYTAAAGTNKYEPWEFALRVRGGRYQVVDRTYVGADLATLTVLYPGSTMPTGTLPFEILLPVALKEPPVDVAAEWAAGVADFSSGGAGPHDIVPTNQNGESLETRNLAQHLVVDGWISAGNDWYQVTAFSETGGMPTSVTVDGTQPTPPTSLETARFRLPLPLVRFDAGLEDDKETGTTADDTLNLPVLAGGGPQLGWLEAGSWVEVVLAGARGTFDPTNATHRMAVVAVTDLNTDTQDFIMPGNFVRVGGRDYEILTELGGTFNDDGTDVTLAGDEFALVGTVRSLNADRKFKIVLGYIPGSSQLPGVARFPVRSVTRTPMGTAMPVTSFEVGRDANGNLPTDLWPDPPDNFINPVHVLPANWSQYSYQVVISPKSPVGTFYSGDSYCDSPVPRHDPPTAGIDPIPYAPTLDSDVMTANGNVFQLRTLTVGDFSGGYFNRQITSVGANATGVVYTRLNLSSAATFDSPIAGYFRIDNDQPPDGVLEGFNAFHAYDENDFYGGTVDPDIYVGTGTYTNPGAGVFQVAFDAPEPDAIFVAQMVAITLAGPSGRAATGVVLVVDSTLDFFTFMPAVNTLNDGDSVQIRILGVGAGPRRWAFGRGQFIQGADTVTAVYLDTAGSFPDPAIPGRGLPYSTAAPRRYHLAVGDYVLAPDMKWYAVKAIHNVADPARDLIVLDRPYAGATNTDSYFRYITPLAEAHTAQVAVFRNYSLRALYGLDGRHDAAAFGYDADGNRDLTKVRLALPCPPDIKPGDFIRADGDASHPAGASPFADPGLLWRNLVWDHDGNGGTPDIYGDQIDGDRRWYMIDQILPDDDPTAIDYRTEITLTAPYEGHVASPGNPDAAWQPASVSNAVIRTYDTVIGAF